MQYNAYVTYGSSQGVQHHGDTVGSKVLTLTLTLILIVTLTLPLSLSLTW